jgi:hypothetical protein
MSINQEVQVNDDGVRRLGFIEDICGEWVWVRLTGQNCTRKFWIEQVQSLGGGR